MNKPAFAFACVGVMLATLVGAGCGSDGSTSVDSTSPITPATATTSTAAPTSTIAGLTATSGPPTTVAALPTVAVTSPPTDPTLTTPPTAEASETTAPAVDTTAVPATTVAPRSSDEFTPVPSPTVPASTQPVTAGSPADGVYFGAAGATGVPSAGGGSVRFILTQLFTGEACVAHFGADDEDACLNDYGVEAVPSAIVEVTLDSQFISVVDAASQQSYQVSGGELYEMLLGGTPAPTAPAGYAYSPFGFLITFEGGTATRLEQWWTP